MKFGPDRRVRKRPEFQAIGRLGQRISTKHFVLILAPAEESTRASRLGITASRKAGNAVVRNRLKRMVRAAFRETEGWVPQGFDLVVICKMHVESMTSDTIVQEWRDATKRLSKAVGQLSRGPRVRPEAPGAP